MLESADAPAASSSKPQCARCHDRLAIYTCPRCSIKTCSLQCSSAHKAASGCSGIRDKSAYVPMNEYGWGKMVDDYVYLEEVGRQVAGWGRDIASHGLEQRNHFNPRGRGRDGGRGGRSKLSGRGMDKLDLLSRQLAAWDVDMDVLPRGMERHKKNKSYWDSKNRTAFLTLELRFQPPSNTLTQPTLTPLHLMTHKNNWDLTLQQLVQRQVQQRSHLKKDDVLYDWLAPLIGLDNDPDTSPPLCLLRTKGLPEEGQCVAQTKYYKLSWGRTLVSSLKHKQFVEFPTIEFMNEDDFSGTLVDEDGLHWDKTAEREPKRRKLNIKAGKKTISALVGNYGSDDEDLPPNALSMLDRYSGSEMDPMEEDRALSDIPSDDDEEQDVEDVEEAPGMDAYPSGLRDLAVPTVEDEDEDDVDWDDSGDDEVHLAKLLEKVRGQAGH